MLVGPWGVIGHTFLSRPPLDDSGKIYFKLAQWFQKRRFFYKILQFLLIFLFLVRLAAMFDGGLVDKPFFLKGIINVSFPQRLEAI